MRKLRKKNTKKLVSRDLKVILYFSQKCLAAIVSPRTCAIVGPRTRLQLVRMLYTCGLSFLRDISLRVSEGHNFSVKTFCSTNTRKDARIITMSISLRGTSLKPRRYIYTAIVTSLIPCRR